MQEGTTANKKKKKVLATTSPQSTETKKRRLKQTFLNFGGKQEAELLSSDQQQTKKQKLTRDEKGKQDEESVTSGTVVCVPTPSRKFNSVFWVNENGAQMEYVNNFMTQTEADTLFYKLLQSEFVYQRYVMNMWGRKVLSPRTGLLIGLKEEKRLDKKDHSRNIYDWFPEIQSLKQSIEAYLKSKYNQDHCFQFALVNRYDSGNDHITWHADREAGTTPIVSMTLGEERTFKVRKIATKEVIVSQNLKHGSMVIMNGTVQQLYHHCVSKTAKLKGTRLNITFRYNPYD